MAAAAPPGPAGHASGAHVQRILFACWCAGLLSARQRAARLTALAGRPVTHPADLTADEAVRVAAELERP